MRKWLDADAKSCLIKKKERKGIKLSWKQIKSFYMHEEWKGLDLEEHGVLVELLVSLKKVTHFLHASCQIGQTHRYVYVYIHTDTHVYIGCIFHQALENASGSQKGFVKEFRTVWKCALKATHAALPSTTAHLSCSWPGCDTLRCDVSFLLFKWSCSHTQPN